MRVYAAGALLGALLAATGAAGNTAPLPSGTALVYAVDRMGISSPRIHALTSVGERPLTPLRPGPSDAPSWSPRRAELAFASSHGRALWLYDATRHASRLLARVSASAPVWSPDGERIAVADDSGSSLSIVHRRDGSLRRVPLPADVRLTAIDWAPDSRRLLVADASSARRPFLVAQPGRRWRALDVRGGSGAHHWFVRWSPDGQSIAFGELSDFPARDSLLTVELRTGRVQRFPGADLPAWAPDSKRLAGTEGERLFIHAADGSRRSFRLPFEPEDLAWAADGSSIVLSFGERLWSFDASTGDVRRLKTRRRLLLGSASTVSHRADAIAVARERSKSIELVTLQGTKRTIAQSSREWAPEWVDNRRVVFERDGLITLLDMGTRREQRLGLGHSPVPSPDGAVVLVRRGESLVLVSLTGGREHLLGQGDSPAWSADGGQVAFIRGAELRVWDRASGAQRVLVHAGERICGSSAVLHSPAFSPDGANVAFTLEEPDDAAVYLPCRSVRSVAAAGGARRTIVDDACCPRFSPDGHLLVQTGFYGEKRLVVLSPQGELRASWPGRSGSWSPDGEWLAWLRTGEIWVGRLNGTERKRVADAGESEFSRPSWRPPG